MHTHCISNEAAVRFSSNPISSWLELCTAYHVFPHRNLDFFLSFPTLRTLPYQSWLPTNTCNWYVWGSFFFFFFSCTVYRAACSACSRDNSCYLCPLVLSPLLLFYYCWTYYFRCCFSTSEQIFSVSERPFSEPSCTKICNTLIWVVLPEAFFPPSLAALHRTLSSSVKAFFCTFLPLGRCVQVNNMEDFDLHGGAASLIAPPLPSNPCLPEGVRCVLLTWPVWMKPCRNWSLIPPRLSPLLLPPPPTNAPCSESQ